MASHARLFAKFGRLAGTDVLVADEATLGRNADNTLVIASRSTSGNHARIFFDPADEVFYLEDLGSLNGTELDGVLIEGREKLGRLHVISIAGRHDLIYQGPQLVEARLAEAGATDTSQPANRPTLPLSPAAIPAQEPPQRERTREQHLVVPLPPSLSPQAGENPKEKSTPEPEREDTRVQHQAIPLPAALAAQPPLPKGATEAAKEIVAPRFQLVFADLEQPRKAELDEGENSVGRSPAVRIQIESPEISRLHAVLTVRGAKVTVRDEGSHNSTYLDGLLVDREMEAEPGATLRFGTIEAQLMRVDE